MKLSFSLGCAAWLIGGVAGIAAAGPGEGLPRGEAPSGLKRMLAQQIMATAPEPQRAALAAALADELETLRDGEVLLLGNPAYARLRGHVTPEAFMRFDQTQVDRLLAIQDNISGGGRPPAMCFAPGTDPAFVDAISSLLFAPNPIAFQQTNRWNGTVLTPASSAQGTPITLTYSFVPDNTSIPDIQIGLGSGTSRLFAWMNGLYGSPATWQQFFHDAFEDWGKLINVTYVFQPTDDGAQLNNSPGVAGVRGDIRIAAFRFQNDSSNGGTLAYNNFPNDGDMVLDAFDTFYSNFANGSQGLRNTIFHEHGHGLGMLHVCPITETKLMEPFISFAFTGPQLDDILNGQRHYGDLSEPNDTAGTADGEIGSLALNQTRTVRQRSIDDNSDTDFFSFTITQASQMTVTAAPAAATYQQGTQTFQCNTGTNTNYNTIHNLAVAITTTGGTVLASSDATAAGSAETLVTVLGTPGTYVVRVTGGTADNIQLYNLTVATAPPPFIPVSISNLVVPEQVDPGETIPVSFTAAANQEAIVGPVRVRYRYDGGAFLTVNAVNAGGNQFTATLPAAFCADTPQVFAEVTGSVTGVVTTPPTGAAAAERVVVGMLSPLDDNFNLDLGWTVSGAATGTADGRWQRGAPAGNGSRGDPTADADGSGSCYLTGNGPDNTDVDAQTILTSPVFSVASVPNATVSYFRWLDNDNGASPNEDGMRVEISNNGGTTWTLLENVAGNSTGADGGWIAVTRSIAGVIAPTAAMRVRFIVEDIGAGSVVEAGVDGFRVGGDLCVDPVTAGPCSAADLAEAFDVLDINDVLAFANAFNAQQAAADLFPDGMFDINDVLAFATAFNAGCP